MRAIGVGSVGEDASPFPRLFTAPHSRRSTDQFTSAEFYLDSANAI